jgi:Flp pilus assembly pilin Flp
MPVFGGGERTECEMKMWKSIKRFRAEENGAVTVDWVVLTAGVVTLVLVAMAGIKGKMTTIGDRTEQFLSSQSINTSF